MVVLLVLPSVISPGAPEKGRLSPAYLGLLLPFPYPPQPQFSFGAAGVI